MRSLKTVHLGLTEIWDAPYSLQAHLATLEIISMTMLTCLGFSPNLLVYHIFIGIDTIPAETPNFCSPHLSTTPR